MSNEFFLKKIKKKVGTVVYVKGVHARGVETRLESPTAGIPRPLATERKTHSSNKKGGGNRRKQRQ